MTVYYLLLLLIVGLGLWTGRDGQGRAKRALYVGIVTLALIAVASLRYGIGFDYPNYIKYLFPQIRALPWGELLSSPAEPGFTILTKALMAISDTPFFLYTVYAVLTIGIVGYVVYRHSALPWLSMFCFVTLQYFASSMNLMRQTLAAAICLLAIPYLQKRRPLPYFLIVLLAASFHKTALILVAVYFLTLLPLNRYTAAAYAGGGLLIFLFSDFLMELALRFTNKTYTAGTVFYEGSSFSYIVILILLAAGVLLAGKRLLIKDERNVVYLDYMIYGIFFSALIVRHSIVERFALYFMMALILTVPMMVLSLRPDESAPVKSDGKFRSDKAKAAYERGQRREQRQVYYSVLAGVCVLCFVHFLLAANYKFHNTYPYYSIFSDEARSGQEIVYIPYGSDEPFQGLYVED
ncbi:EpsG family protein [Harryflintia acetispora]|uniref:EpsG family protein n=1 Tax=Harryflintia acetispora TaxID=1849041 RepID=UPI00189AAAA4|nr:EpsG family protein [Harryflintia acetispora]